MLDNSFCLYLPWKVMFGWPSNVRKNLKCRMQGYITKTTNDIQEQMGKSENWTMKLILKKRKLQLCKFITKTTFVKNLVSSIHRAGRWDFQAKSGVEWDVLQLHRAKPGWIGWTPLFWWENLEFYERLWDFMRFYESVSCEFCCYGVLLWAEAWNEWSKWLFVDYL